MAAPRILIVDDLADNRQLLVQLLDTDFLVTIAENGAEAIASIERERPDLMLLDLMMPVLDGFAVLAHLQAHPAPFLPVIVVTAATERPARLAALRAGAHEFLDKPVDAEELIVRIATLLDLKRSREESEAAKSEAEAATLHKSAFMATMSHEIRTPLTAIIGIADLFAATSLTAEQERYVAIFRRAGANLLTLVNGLLDLSKIEANKLELEEQPFDLLEQLALVTEVAGLAAAAKGLVVTCAPADDLPCWVVGDAHRLHQVLDNLLSNAVKFTHQGEIVLRARRDPSAGPDGLHFSVSDTGEGIPGERLTAIFEQFTQADLSTARRFGGTGLGLAIARRMVERMGGRLWVESEVAHGSTFHFTVSLALVPPADRSPPLPPPRASDFARGMRVLLAEDSEDNRIVFEAYFEGLAHQIDFVGDGAEAVERFMSAPYDLVLMDMQMPVMDGFTATREIRRWEASQGRVPTPILALTAFALHDELNKSLEAGCNGHLTKPISKDAMLSVVAAVSAGSAFGHVESTGR